MDKKAIVKLFMELLEKYEDSEKQIICEFCGIEEKDELKKLGKEIIDYRERIKELLK